MRENLRSFKPCASKPDGEKGGDTNILKRARRRLQERFDVCQYRCSSTEKRCVEKSWNNFSIPSVSVSRLHPSRVLRSGANTLSKTLNSMQTTFGTLSQKFRRSTKRRYQLKNESPCSPLTPQTRSRHLLGRTPTKLYSPFGIDSPCKKVRGKENDRCTPRRILGERNKTCSSTGKSVRFIGSESLNEQKNFDPDMEEVRIGIWELRQTANRIVKRAFQY